jgi:hypothetical protein
MHGTEVRRQLQWKEEWGVDEGENKVGGELRGWPSLYTPTQHRQSLMPQEQRSPEERLRQQVIVRGHCAAASVPPVAASAPALSEERERDEGQPTPRARDRIIFLPEERRVEKQFFTRAMKC